MGWGAVRVEPLASGEAGSVGAKLLQPDAQTRRGRGSWKEGDGSVLRNYPGGPVVTTSHFQCRGRGFNLWLGN